MDDSTFFPEDRFPCNDEGYLHAVSRGHSVCSDVKVVICGVVRDCKNRLMRTWRGAELTGMRFKDYEICVYENDSVDGTKKLLKDWAKRNPKVHVKSENLGKKRWGMVRSPRRGDDMAQYRNEVRKMALQYDPDLVIMIDLDVCAWSLDGISHTMSEWSNWDSVGSNGLRWDGNRYHQMDAWAWRKYTWKPQTFAAVKNITPIRGTLPWKMRCCFGGMGLYTRKVMQNISYGGGELEHVTFHKRMRRAGYERCFFNPSQIVIYRWG